MGGRGWIHKRQGMGWRVSGEPNLKNKKGMKNFIKHKPDFLTTEKEVRS